MNSKIYVGNLSYDASSEDLQSLFCDCGEIKEVKLIVDHSTGRSKGFGFITFATAEGASDAIKHNGTEIQGRQIRVSPAKNDNNGGRSGGGHRANNNHGGNNYNGGGNNYNGGGNNYNGGGNNYGGNRGGNY